MCEWGGYSGEQLWLNLYHWFWAIADGGRPSDIDAAWLASVLAISLERASFFIGRADLYFASCGRTNARTGQTQHLASCTKKELRARADRLGLKTTGWDLKADIITRLVDHEYPVIRFESLTPPKLLDGAFRIS